MGPERVCDFPQCSADAEWVEKNLWIAVCTEHRDLFSPVLAAALDREPEWLVHDPARTFDMDAVNKKLDEAIWKALPLLTKN